MHKRSWRERWSPNGEAMLAAALAAELFVFSAIAPNFMSVGNFFEVVRLSVELGLLCLAMTPIVITGGIDLSVGSLMGLAAVVLSLRQVVRLPRVSRQRVATLPAANERH